ncbi:MAG: desulfoferrodoxin family protein [Candidatus Margulisbacteria bacterium]|nr:desulfoferrodoxin family protein [Candidatus Margulisiibacteriota bacterium]
MSLFDQVNTSKSAMEQKTSEKHVPILKVERLNDSTVLVNVNAGGGKHPNEMDHWFQWTIIRVNELYVGRTEFSAVIMEPVTTFALNVKPGAVITARSRCNVHGIWESDPVTV